VVLACVAYYLPIYRSVTNYHDVVDAAVEGAPEHRSGEDLHTGAWPLIEPRAIDAAAQDRARYHEASGTGRSTTDLATIVAAAHEGRVDLLFVDEGTGPWGRLDPETGAVTVTDSPTVADRDLVDSAIGDTLTRGGRVQVAPHLLDGAPAGALLRY
jgi:hypothetical protein